MGRYRLASHRTTRIMKIFVALSTLLAAATCQEAQVLATYAGYHPYAAAGYPYAAAPYAAYAPYSAGSQFSPPPLLSSTTLQSSPPTTDLVTTDSATPDSATMVSATEDSTVPTLATMVSTKQKYQNLTEL